jgi:hypothetical protein
VSFSILYLDNFSAISKYVQGHGAIADTILTILSAAACIARELSSKILMDHATEHISS